MESEREEGREGEKRMMKGTGKGSRAKQSITKRRRSKDQRNMK